MPRALLCWEMGKNRGHMEPLAQVGNALEQHGYEVAYALRDTHTAATVLNPEQHRWYQAPITVEPLIRAQHPRNYSEILVNCGFGQAHEVVGRLHAWRQLLDQTQPELLIADYAPTALLAAHAQGVPSLAIGSGFLIPPDIAPWPAFRHWEDHSTNELARLDDTLLAVINQAYQQLGYSPLENVQALYRKASQTLLTVAALDHYPQRPETQYLGALPPPAKQAQPTWPDVAGKRIFAYLHPFKTLPDLLTLLANSDASVEIVLSTNMPELIQRFSHHSNLHFATQPVDLAQTAAQCDLAICHSGHGTVATLLEAGKPLLLLPLNLEMLLTAQRIQNLGAGLAAPGLQPGGMRTKLQRLLQEDSFAQAAEKFATNNAALSSTGTLDRLLAQIREIA